MDNTTTALQPHQLLVQEQKDLAENAVKLRAFLATPTFMALTSAEQERLQRQLAHMTLYDEVLLDRIGAFHGAPPEEVARPSELMVHDVKCWITFYGMLRNGVKNFEVRRNDRRYRVGDMMRLREWNPSKEDYTGRETYRAIAYILAGGQFGVQDDHVILGFTQAPRANTEHYNALMAFQAWRYSRLTSDDAPPGGMTAFADQVGEYCELRGIPTK